jgi:hypothetical protein
MKLVELGKPLDGLIPKVSREHIHLLWAIDYWDGPIQGVLEFDGEVLCFVLAEESDADTKTGWYRRYWLSVSQMHSSRSKAGTMISQVCGCDFDYDEVETDQSAKLAHRWIGRFTTNTPK